ncbi:MAG: hypothetical protein MZV64_16935 [Ignavibacteriales bacterium]|nr:hypothetical protein [Ignavibacteriales bacterium]
MGFCPFCPGNEEQDAARGPGLPPQRLGTQRVRAGIFASCRTSSRRCRSRAISNRQGDGMYDKMNGIGAHEVVIETPEHARHPRQHERAGGSRTSCGRSTTASLDLKKDPRLQLHPDLQERTAAAAGASLEHPHSQLIATAHHPQAGAGGAGRGQGVLQLQGALRLLRHRPAGAEPGGPPSSARTTISSPSRRTPPRFPFEAWILPKRHDPFFEDAPEARVRATCSKLLRDLVAADGEGPAEPSLQPDHPQLARCAKRTRRYYHWHIELMPKLTHVAGFEWGSGFYINPTPPEDAAKYLRDAKV